ncbi:diguanylate cyclase domain-containing protein [Sphingomonas sp. BAUL-RG-20F-R05-02]|uniref:diguanylate cyclase domain-containing protein n=1 Tax=Sphingomonas sp. BAUL-RG-20F-R05-02 TaxID=2914830 RepID=UPI001F59D8B8|nr:diguanylate cyclase [Sphingomonas sp. BAUL-RG-20F-R05-02]
MVGRAVEKIGLPYEIEAARLSTLADLDILDTPPEHEFDTIVEIARRSFGCKIALVSLIDEHRQWFKAKSGLHACETPRGQAFCSYAILRDDLMVVPDATEDPRFADNPLVKGPPHMRFYAGMPLRVGSGRDDGASFAMGTLCIIDTVPRTLSPGDADMLRRLAKLVESLLNTRAALAVALKTESEHRTLLRQLDVTHRQFRQAERMTNIGSWTLTLADEGMEWSEQVYRIHGLPTGSPPPLDAALRFYPPRARAEVAAALAHTIATGEPLDLETDFVNAQGQDRRVRTLGEVELRDGVPHALVGVFQDITERHRIEQALRRSADTDDLTQLANRARFNDMLARQMFAARRTDLPLALLLIDLDHFKTVNDRAGHRAGDVLLKAVAEQLTAPYLADCFAARLGGDEFVMIVTDEAMLADLPSLLRRLLADLRLPIAHGDAVIPVSGTIGAAFLDSDVIDASALLHNADLALYQAKNASRGTAAIFGRAGTITSADAADTRSRAA